MSEKSKLTKIEKQAIAELKKLAEHWPSTLMLFSWSGSLCVMKGVDYNTRPDDYRGMMRDAVVADIAGITNDGGCP